jgi:hypothetical protein
MTLVILGFVLLEAIIVALRPCCASAYLMDSLVPTESIYSLDTRVNHDEIMVKYRGGYMERKSVQQC